MVIEKGLDSHSEGGIAQQDIEKYYDSIRLLLVARWLVSNGAPYPLVATALRLQMLPLVFLHIGDQCIPIAGRAVGSLTGSRTAGAFGRVPVESTIKENHPERKKWGFDAGSRILTVATYVDNIYSAGSSMRNAINILEDFATHLKNVWRLEIKPNSRLCCAPCGSTETPDDPGRWVQRAQFPVLVHVLSDNGATHACWTATRRAMLRAFFGNCASKSCRPLDTSTRFSLLNRAVLPILQHRDTRWPPSAQRQQDVDRLQRQMVGSILRVKPVSGEQAADYVRRRNMITSRQMNKLGKWSAKHFERVLAWESHLRRP